MTAVGEEMHREHAASWVIGGAEHHGARAVAEQDGRVPAAGRLVEPARVHLGADQEDAAVGAGADPGVGHGETVQEAAALVPHVDRGDVADAQLALQEYAVAGLEMVGGAGAVDDAVEIAGLEAGLGQGLAGGLARQRDAGLAVRHPVARLDAAALRDPLIRRVHEPGQVVMGDEPGRDVKAGGDELGARHQDLSRYPLRATGERGRFRPRVAKARDAHGPDGHTAAVRRRAGSETSSGCAEAGARPSQAVGSGLRAPSDVRGGDGAQRAVRLERAHRRGRERDARVARVRRSREGNHHTSGLLTIMRHRFVLLGILPLAPSLFPLPVVAQKRAITFDDYIALKSVGDPQLSPDGKWVAYTVTEQPLKDNRGTTRIWLADVATGQSRELTAGPGSDRQPRWAPDGKTLAFVSTRQNGAQLWVLPLAGGEARRVTSLPDGVFDPVWLPDGKALLVTSDIKWPAAQEIDRRAGDYPTEARLWTGLFYRHWDDWRVGKRQHVFRVGLAGDGAKDLTPVDHDVPTIATGGDGDVAVAPDGREIAVAMHLDSTVADNTNVDIVLLDPAGSGTRPLTTSRGADNTPRYSPDGKWLTYLSLERPGFEADRQRLMVLRRKNGRTESGAPTEVTFGWTLSVGSYAWCADSKCIYAVVEERGRENIHRIDLPSFRHSVAVGGGGGGGGVNTNVRVTPDGREVVYLHQSNTQPAEVWASGRQLTHHNDQAVAALDLKPLQPFGFVGAPGDPVFGWLLKPPGFDPAKRYPLAYLVHGGPQSAWADDWHPRWNYQMLASRGYVVAAVNFHGSTGYGQKFTDAISQHWGDYPFEDLMKGLDVVARLPYVDSTRMGAAGASYGGYMVYWIAGHTNRFKVLVDHDGVFNAASMYGTTEELWFVEWEFGGTVYALKDSLTVANRALYEKWSPLNFAQNWRTPMLVVHSQLDYRVDLSEGYQAFTALKKMGVPAKFLYFPDEGHWVLKPRNRRVWWSTVLDWLDQYLQPPAATGAR